MRQRNNKGFAALPILCAIGAGLLVGAGVFALVKTGVLPAGTDTSTQAEESVAQREELLALTETGNGSAQVVQSAETFEGVTATITFTDDGISVEGDGVEVSDSKVTITQAGTYVLSGEMENARVKVEAGEEDDVTLILNGVGLTNDTDEVIYAKSAGSVTVYLPEGSVNYLISGEESDVAKDTVEDASDDTANAGADEAANVDTQDGNMTAPDMGGNEQNGEMTPPDMNGNEQNGEMTPPDMNGNEQIGEATPPDMNGNEQNGNMTPPDMDDDDTEDEDTDTEEVSGGALRAKADMTITGEGTLTIAGYINNGIQTSKNLTIESGTITVTAANKGLKGNESITITGGSFVIEAEDDALHSDGNITISGGTFTISSGDDGIHADAEVLIEDGTIVIEKSYEGIEGNQITVSGGTIDITASDDGFNAYGGSGNDIGGTAKTTEETPNLIFNGGTVHVNAGGDGIDSNGNIIVNGGLIQIDGPVSNGESAIDVGTENGGTCVVNGGTVIAIGSSGMAETFGSDSTQCSFLYNFETSFDAGTEITILDSKGNTLYTYTAEKSFSSVVFSSADLTDGETYTLQAGEESVEITCSGVSTSAGTSSMGGMSMDGMNQGMPGSGTDGPGSADGEAMTPPDGAGDGTMTPPSGMGDGTMTPPDAAAGGFEPAGQGNGGPGKK